MTFVNFCATLHYVPRAHLQLCQKHHRAVHANLHYQQTYETIPNCKLRMQHSAYHFTVLYACVARRKGKQCALSQTSIKGLWLFFLGKRLLAAKTK